MKIFKKGDPVGENLYCSKATRYMPGVSETELQMRASPGSVSLLQLLWQNRKLEVIRLCHILKLYEKLIKTLASLLESN
jgi:hypothetical protein